MKETTNKLIQRLELIKDSDPFNKQILNDCYLHLQRLQDEVDRLVYHNNNLMNVIYQNQDTLESGTDERT